MILVDARCTILPERREDFLREVRRIVPVVRKEAGCSRYDLLGDSSDPATFHFIEAWESQDHLDSHLTEPHMEEYFALTGPWRACPTLLTIYEVGSWRSITIGE
jgi:quinol monooxygenase YgiN